MATITEVLTQAVTDFSTHGYDNSGRLDYWVNAILESANVKRNDKAPDQIKRSMQAKYRQLVDNGGILKAHKIPLFTLEQVKPKLRAELDRRIMASADLIVLRREANVQHTVQRFCGWATSIPVGGSNAVDKVEVKKDLYKHLKNQDFIDRRVAIDQGHKLIANINDIVATDAGAIAAIWHSHWRDHGYDYDPKHKIRDKKVYAIRGNWAIQQGLMKPGPNGYTDDEVVPAERPFCQCFYQYLYNLDALPDDMLTIKYKAVTGQAKKPHYG